MEIVLTLILFKINTHNFLRDTSLNFPYHEISPHPPIVNLNPRLVGDFLNCSNSLLRKCFSFKNTLK
jgi:hypothetical protein